jgi:hypothetical protein
VASPWRQRSRPPHRLFDGGRLIAQAAQRPRKTPRSFVSNINLDTSTLLFAILTLCLVGVTFHAWRLGNEKRDVVLLGVISALTGAGTAVAAILQI